MRAEFDRAETRVREVANGGFFAREGGFSTISSVWPPSTSDRPRFFREVGAFPSVGTEVDIDRVTRRGGIGKSVGQGRRGRDRDASQGELLHVTFSIAFN